MNTVSAADMLSVWERGLNQSPLQRALILLVAAYPDVKPDELARLSIGERDRRLLRLRQRCFGSRLANTAFCPACTERLEWENSVSDIYVAPPPAVSQGNQFDFHSGNYHIFFRLPNSRDIDRVLGQDDAQQALITRCIARAECAGKAHPVDKLPHDIIQAAGQHIEQMDPQAEIKINLECPACSHRWNVLFDITSFLWAELSEWAQRTLHTVFRLARGYGWTEKDILNLSAVRRQLYLGMLG
ncbi:phage baseplate protein [Exilibacterium tricleocarpae]|uniref:Phage baseplate protein n=1 Tax=Exilibacterium tricleocarpae TaxID=2591008 RepID=A0A545TZ46_9GAMM|nr:phage baseplate protein [Exilibacterium tricleocarpae]TQV82488.1 phage baseplate protein [Exilibacterium tricleocarpae]